MAAAPILKTAAYLLFVVVAPRMGISIQAQTRGNENSAAASKALIKLPAEYQRWLDHEVRWIISPEERAAFVQLSTRTGRDHFVEAFWQRRSPSASGAKNEFKEQHYRRLAYANEHFAYSVPGGETDRGRIYIVYGPPTASKSGSIRHLNGSSKPTELWHYDLIPGLGENVALRFVDFCNCGDFRLETPLKD